MRLDQGGISMSHSRSGVSLIELLVVMSVGSTIFLIAVGWIHQSMSIASRMKQRELHHGRLMELSRSLRADAIDASEISLEGNRLEIVSDGKTRVTYTIQSNVLDRRQSLDSTVSVNRFELRRESAPSWIRDETSGSLALVVYRGGSHLGDRPDGSQQQRGFVKSVVDLHVVLPTHNAPSSSTLVEP
jgi:prepilin-type N-terminal cleavage/methylation domain-containing protein